MDPAKRERLQNQIMLVQLVMHYPKFILTGIVGLPIMAYMLVAGDIVIMNREWEHRDYVKATAEITEHNVSQDGRAFDHDLQYRYPAGDQEIVGKLTVQSTNQSKAQIGPTIFKPMVGGRMRVYYKSDAPERHAIFYDPGVAFWTSAKRLLYLLLAVLTAVMIAMLVVVFYRPQRTVRDLPNSLTATPTPVTTFDASDFKINA
jgi:hypothetical protein